MKKYLMIMTMVLTVHAVMADGVFIVNKDYKAYDWEEFDSSCGTPIGIYVESKGCTLMSSMTYPYCTLADAKAREAKYSEEAHLARMFEFMTMSDVRDLFNKAMNKIWDISGRYMMDYRDPVSDHGLWLSNGKIGYYYYEDGMKYESERNPEENEQSYALLLFNDSFKNRVIKYKKTQVSPESGKITTSASVKTIDKSGAHYQNRGYTYTNLIEDVTVTLSKINTYFKNPPSGMIEGGCPIVRVYLVKFLPNGNPETVGTYDIDVIPDPAKDEWKSPQTQTVRFKTPWRNLWNRYGRGTVKYQYQIAIPRKAGPELLYKTPVRQITITNMPQPRR